MNWYEDAIQVAGYLLGALTRDGAHRDDFEIRCVGYPVPGATNILEMTNPRTNMKFQITVERVE